jgi:hypothetical protein
MKMTKAEWLTKNGFNENGLTWCVFGDDTYAIKDKLKEWGCKFSPLLKWHSANPIDIPIGYGMFSISFDTIAQWDEENETICYYEKAKEIVDRQFREAEGPSLSEYVGTPGERLRNLTAIYKSTRGFSGKYGWTNIHTFEVGDNILVWFTQCDVDLERGQAVDLTATVKKHEEFRGVKTTQLSRCIIKPIGE